MSDLSIQSRMIGLIGTTGALAGVMAHTKNQKEALAYQKERDVVKDKQFDQKMASKSRDQDIKEAEIQQKADELKEKGREFDKAQRTKNKELKMKQEQYDTKIEQQNKDRELKKYQADLLDKERMASNTVAAKEAETHRITADSRAEQQRAKTTQMDIENALQAGMYSSQIMAGQSALQKLGFSLKTNADQKEAIAQLSEGLKEKKKRGRPPKNKETQ